MKRTILLVTRHPGIRTSVRALRGPDLRVLHESSGLGVLFLCATQSVDVLVIQPTIPGMDWARLLDKVSAAFPSLPVLAVNPAEGAEVLRERIRAALNATTQKKQPETERALAAGGGERRRA